MKPILFLFALLIFVCSAQTSRASLYVTVSPNIYHFGNVNPAAAWPLPVLQFKLLESLGGTAGSNVTFVATQTGQGIVAGSPLNTPFALGPATNFFELLSYSITVPTTTGYFVGYITIKDVGNLNLQQQFKYDGNVVPPVGLSDYVQLMTAAGVGPSTFSPTTGSPIPSSCTLSFCPIRYSAKFFDFDNSGTSVNSWSWKVQLYHSTGTYDLPLPVTSTTMDLQISNSFTLPPKAWSRDANGNILTKVQVDIVDSDGFGHHAERVVGIKYPPNKTVGTRVIDDAVKRTESRKRSGLLIDQDH
jgi:hypothetical protein